MAKQNSQTGMQLFLGVMSQYKRLGSWAVTLTVAGPLTDFILRVGPPWPPSSAVLTSITQFVTLILVFQFGESSRKRKIAKMLAVMAFITAVIFITYVYAADRFTFTSPVNEQRYVKGFQLRPDVAPLLTPSYTAENALRGSEYDPSAVWTQSSIALMKVTILVLWLASFAGLASIVGTFIVHSQSKYG